MNEDIKMSMVFGSLMFGIIFTILGIVAIVRELQLEEKCTYLEKQIEQQTMLIEYLKSEED